MAAKPTDPIPTWATDTNFASGPDSGTPTKVAPSVGFRAQGWVPEDPALAQFENFLKNQYGQWIEWVDTLFGSDGFHNFEKPVVAKSFTRLCDARIMRVTHAVAAGSPSWFLGGIGANQYTSQRNNAKLILPLSDVLPGGKDTTGNVTVTLVRMMVRPGLARAPGARMSLSIDTVAYSTAAPAAPIVTSLGTQEDDGTTGFQMITSGALAVTLDKNGPAHADILVTLEAGDTGAADPDEALMIEITYEIDGLRPW